MLLLQSKRDWDLDPASSGEKKKGAVIVCEIGYLREALSLSLCCCFVPPCDIRLSDTFLLFSAKLFSRALFLYLRVFAFFGAEAFKGQHLAWVCMCVQSRQAFSPLLFLSDKKKRVCFFCFFFYIFFLTLLSVPFFPLPLSFFLLRGRSPIPFPLAD
jgi:hypothetical protein